MPPFAPNPPICLETHHHATNSFMSKNNVCSSVCLGFLSDQSSIIVYPCPLVHLIYVTLAGEVAESEVVEVAS